MEIKAITTVVSTARRALELLREARNHIPAGEEREKVDSALATAQERLLGVGDIALQLQEELSGLRARVEELEGRLTLKGQIRWDEKSEVYWLRDAESGAEEGPFCSRCWDVDGGLVHLQTGGDPEYWTCPSCRNARQKKISVTW